MDNSFLIGALIFILCVIALGIYEGENKVSQEHALIIKCMEKDTPANCALIFKKGKSK